MTTKTISKPATTGLDASDTGLSVAIDINVHIPDLNQNVPGTDLRIWKYKEQVDPAWEPGPDFPAIVSESLPQRRSDLATESIMAALRKNRFSKNEPIIQALNRTKSIDTRKYRTTRWSNTKCGNVDLPPEEYTPYEGVSGGLFLNTVHNCFDQHLPLGIRPESLMWMILHEVGVTVRQNPDAYRDFFTSSPHKRQIQVRDDSLRLERFDQAEQWAHGISAMYTKLQDLVPSDIIEDMMPSLSTHDFDSQVASMVAVLDAASPYYSLGMTTACGIPNIRLFGTPQDYDAILASATMLSEKFHAHLGMYFEHLLPVLKEISDTAAGRKEPDNDFWSSIYNHYSGSGTDDMDGWITAFVNYIHGGEEYVAKDPGLYDWKANLNQYEGRSFGSGIHRSLLPQHISMVPFVWTITSAHTATTDNYDCRLVGGFLGVDDVDGYATPALSYAVLRGDVLAA